MPVIRSPHNPLIQPADVPPSRPDFEVIGVLNAGVACLGSEVILLMRVVERPRQVNPAVCQVPVYDPHSAQLLLKEFAYGAPGYDFSDPRMVGTPQGLYLSAISHLRIARSQDGIHFTIANRPALFPENEYETYGIEDPRITQIGDVYYINYVAVSPLGIVTALASTRDFVSYQRLAVIFPPDNKDVAIFPERIEGKYYALHRPSTSAFGKPEMWLAESPDLLCWGNHRRLIGVRPDSWEETRIGASAVPLRTPHGWLEIYHGADRSNRYGLAALLLDLKQPWKVLGRSAQPFLLPEADYEVNGFFGNAVFSCGLLAEADQLKIYYGAADTCIAYAEVPIAEVLASIL